MQTESEKRREENKNRVKEIRDKGLIKYRRLEEKKRDT